MPNRVLNIFHTRMEFPTNVTRQRNTRLSYTFIILFTKHILPIYNTRLSYPFTILFVKNILPIYSFLFLLTSIKILS